MSAPSPSTTSSFIHSSLDDSGLDTSAFRVLCRIIRRGDCVESVDNMALGCRLHPDTVWDSLKRLIDHGMVSRIPRPGRPTLYRVTPDSEWKSAPTGNEGAPESKGYPSKPGGTHRKVRGTPTGNGGVRSVSLEVSPSKYPSKATHPTLSEVQIEAKEIGLPEREATRFFNHFSSNGWKVGGKAPMRDWKRALANWKMRWEEPPQRSPNRTPTRPESNQRQEDIPLKML